MMDRKTQIKCKPAVSGPLRCRAVFALARCVSVVSCAVVICAVGLCVSIGQAVEETPAVATLKQHDIAPTATSLAKYLHSLHPSEDARAGMAALVEQLGDDDFLVREAAMKHLLRLPVVADDLLQKAVDGEDLEIRWRATLIQHQADGRAARVLHAALQTIEERELKGLAEPILAALPLCKEQYMRQAARRALQATSRPEDVELLLRALASEQRETRIAGIETLPMVIGVKAVADLHALLEDKDDFVSVAAAVAVANLGQRDALRVFGRLLDSQELAVRTRSGQALRALTGQDFHFVAYDKPEQRLMPVKAWRDWLMAEGKTAKLDYPIREARILLGRTLICYYGLNKVVELDAAGKQTWETAVMQPWGCQGLPNGHRLIASYNNSLVVEYDNEGKEVWKLDGLPGRPFSVERLENGNTLVPFYSTNKIAEYSPDKKSVWEVNLDGNPMDAHRLASGNTLVCLLRSNSVVEVDRAGKIVWTLDNMFGPRSAQRLENGNTLVSQTNGGKVVEVDPEKHIVWSKDGLNNPFDAQRLPNGNTLIVDGQGIREVDVQGKVVWEQPGGGVSRISRY
jgi:HEAT repeat protein